MTKKNYNFVFSLGYVENSMVSQVWLSRKDKADLTPLDLINKLKQNLFDFIIRKEIGARKSGPAPYGYMREGFRNLVINPEEAPNVKLIYREYLRRRSMNRLIDWMNDQGIRTRGGRLWSRAGVSWVLGNETYLGHVHLGKIRATGQHPPLISPIIFNKVQKLIHRNKRGGKPRKEEKKKIVSVVAEAAKKTQRAKVHTDKIKKLLRDLVSRNNEDNREIVEHLTQAGWNFKMTSGILFQIDSLDRLYEGYENCHQITVYDCKLVRKEL